MSRHLKFIVPWIAVDIRGIRLRRYLLALAVSVAGVTLGVAAADAVVGTPIPPRVPAEAWVGDMNVRNLRAACESQAEGNARGPSGGELCGGLPTNVPESCPRSGVGAKPPYRKGEIRIVQEQVGKYSEESPTRGFFPLYAQVKASNRRGALGVEEVEGEWRITYLRFGSQTFMPAGNVYQVWPAFYKLWISSMCRVNHPKWEKKGSR